MKGKKNLSASEFMRNRTGEKHPMFGKKRPDSSRLMRENNPMKRPEIVVKSVAKRNGENSSSKRLDVRDKMSKAKIGENHYFFGKKRPDISKRMKRENNPNWQGGISFEPYGISFNNTLKEQIRQRDNYQCQECSVFQKDLGYKLPVHHIDFDKQNNDQLNLISLCKCCHPKTNYNRKDWIDYYKNKVGSLSKQV